MTDTVKGVRLIPLGGLGETGALNTMLYETENDAILVDCGVQFVDDRFPGASVIIPDFSYLDFIKHKIRAVVLTHGHEDHIGALPYLLKNHGLPVYATEFTRGVVRGKLEEFGLESTEICPLEFGKPVTIGDFQIDPVFVNHSMIDVAALLINACDQKIFHCTDFKIDHSAPEGKATDLARFNEIGKQGLDLFLSDSTNSLSPGWTNSEFQVRSNLIEVFTKTQGRILTCLFSSNTIRIQSLLECARITKRKVAFTGRSTKEYVRIAMAQNRLNDSGVEIMDIEELAGYPDEEVLVIVTGSQAEPRSVLSRMSRGMFKPFPIKEGDTLLMSSKMIPGNEGRILDMLDRLCAKGARIIETDREHPIHASGHAKQDELREVIRLLKPKHFIPIHGSYRHLIKHQEIAIEEGVSPQNTAIVLNGDLATLNEQGLQKQPGLGPSVEFVSENLNDMILGDAIQRRRKMAWNGCVFVSVIYNHAESKVQLPVQAFSEGIFGGPREAELIKKLKEHLEEKVLNETYLDYEKVVKFFKVETRHFYKVNTSIRPEVVVVRHDI
ncbi:MAG: ribonuclease J [Deltaproteobacteria bacterium]|nr:ribonuclease J [Deltaproteobacteria bacterium]